MKKLLFALFALVIFSGCSLVNDNDDIYEKPILELSTSSLSFGSAGGEQTFKIESNEIWEITNIPEWATFSLTKGYRTTKITVEVNPSVANLTQTVTITSKDISHTLTLSQTGAAVNLSVSPKNLIFDAEAQKLPVTISSNVTWTISNTPEWCTIVDGKTTGTGENQIIELEVTANNSTSPRTATLTVTAGDKTEQITIAQAAFSPSISVSNTTALANVPAAGGEFKFNVISNTAWTFRAPIAEGLMTSIGGGIGNKEITLTIEPNTTLAIRTFTLELDNADNTISTTVDITQLAEEAPVEPVIP